MQLNLIINDVTKQLMAWLAIGMLLVQPLGMTGNDCGCSSSGVNESAMASCSLEASAKSFCCSMNSSAESCCVAAKTSCCSASDQLSNTPCKCGDHCLCSLNEPAMPLPAIPSNKTQNDQVKTLTLPTCHAPMAILRTGKKVGFQSFTVNRRPLTAQQTCALLSRFIV